MSKEMDALSGLLSRYIELVNSGDCGSWNPEKENAVINARAALAAAQAGALPEEMTDNMMNAGQNYLNQRSLSGSFHLPATFNWHEFWREIIRALRPAETAESTCPTCGECLLDNDEPHAFGLCAPPPSASEPAGAQGTVGSGPEKAYIEPLAQRLINLSCRHAAKEWPELQSALREAAACLGVAREPAGPSEEDVARAICCPLGCQAKAVEGDRCVALRVNIGQRSAVLALLRRGGKE